MATRRDNDMPLQLGVMFLYLLKEIFRKKSSLDLPKIIIIPNKFVLWVLKILLDHWIIKDHHYTIKSHNSSVFL